MPLETYTCITYSIVPDNVNITKSQLATSLIVALWSREWKRWSPAVFYSFPVTDYSLTEPAVRAVTGIIEADHISPTLTLLVGTLYNLDDDLKPFSFHIKHLMMKLHHVLKTSYYPNGSQSLQLSHIHCIVLKQLPLQVQKPESLSTGFKLQTETLSHCCYAAVDWEWGSSPNSEFLSELPHALPACLYGATASH